MATFWFRKLRKYKYQLVQKDIVTVLPPMNRMVFAVAVEKIRKSERTLFFDLSGTSEQPKLTIKVGYAWNGASGPTWDDKTNYGSSAVHDTLYQMIEVGILPEDDMRKYADDFLYEQLIKCGMNKFRAKYYWFGVRVAGGLVLAEAKKERELIIKAII